ncbi:hypothetical protein D9619_011468 [Psilocybe cf. subviscida]|uniref:Isopenicillin N synthase-like Fe(2+) 2OG dioxygenase domain-containing protein n=1 Tax=Psilocybe cf. subviscida TaxID=2480587 RepID=A0A8H5BUH5_9AGAR|nr:hypothetical protein D9619_011468 [Psilocybe cf. subviscida]
MCSVSSGSHPDVQPHLRHDSEDDAAPVKVVEYPAVKDGAEGQGMGPHYDAGFLTFFSQASLYHGLQVQNLAGEWIDAPPTPGYLRREHRQGARVRHGWPGTGDVASRHITVAQSAI